MIMLMQYAVGMALVDGDILIPKEQLPIYEKEGFDGLVRSDAWLNGPLWPTKTIGVGIAIQGNSQKFKIFTKTHIHLKIFILCYIDTLYTHITKYLCMCIYLQIQLLLGRL